VTPTERLFKQEYAHELLAIANNDLAAAKTLITNPAIRPETVLFQIEQSIEKALKAVICYKKKPVPLTHDILSILGSFSEDNLPPGGYALHDLTPFATIRRYVEGIEIISREDIDHAIGIAEQVLAWAHDIISKKTSHKK